MVALLGQWATRAVDCKLKASAAACLHALAHKFLNASEWQVAVVLGTPNLHAGSMPQGIDTIALELAHGNLVISDLLGMDILSVPVFRHACRSIVPHIFSGGMASIAMFYIIALGCGAKLMWLAVQLCHLIAVGIESTFHSQAGPDHSDWAAALLPKGCRLDMDSSMKQAMVKDSSQGSMTQHRLWSLAPLHKLLVRYWLAGREFYIAQVLHLRHRWQQGGQERYLSWHSVCWCRRCGQSHVGATPGIHADHRLKPQCSAPAFHVYRCRAITESHGISRNTHGTS